MLAKSLCAPPPALIDFKGLDTSFFKEKLISFAIAGESAIYVTLSELFAR